jgi:hypothetical protein
MQQPVKVAALCASPDPDSFQELRDDKDQPIRAPEDVVKPRGHTVPRVGWWCEMATAAAAEFTHVELAAILRERFDYAVSSTSIGRTLNGDVLTLETALHISNVFGLPPPVIIPASEQEALTLLGQQQREQIRAQLSVIRAGVAKKLKKDQPPSVTSKGVEPRRKR